MGYALSWVAVKGGTSDAVQSALGLRPSGQREEFPESDIVAAALPNGWYLVVYRGCAAANRARQSLSRSGEVVYCSVEEHVMVSAASAWKDGKCLWSVVHDGRSGIYDLQVKGPLPASFASIRDRQKSQTGCRRKGRHRRRGFCRRSYVRRSGGLGAGAYRVSARSRCSGSRGRRLRGTGKREKAVGFVLNAGVRIRRAQPADRAPLADLFHALWPEGPVEEHSRELEAILSGNPSGTLPLVVFVAEANLSSAAQDKSLLGFLEVGLRSHADHCDSAHPVGYVEGWYVVEGHRHRGIGKQLLAAAEDWARSQGCVEMASDTQIGNELSQRVHQSLGYEIVERAILFRKALR